MSIFSKLFKRKKGKTEEVQKPISEIVEEVENPESEDYNEAEFTETVSEQTVNENEMEDNECASTVSRSERCGRFEIKKSKDGRYVFNLYASNHVIIATSQVYSSSTSAVGGIKSVIANAEKAGIEDTTLQKKVSLPYPKWEIYLDKGGQYRFRLNAQNGSCVCHSQGYTTKANCKKGIQSIIRFAKGSSIEKIYLKKDS